MAANDTPPTTLSKPGRYARLTVRLGVIAALFVGPIGVTQGNQSHSLPEYVLETYGAPPAIPTGELSEELEAAVNSLFVDSMAAGRWDSEQTEALRLVAQSEDPRLAWPITDMMRFIRQPQLDATMAVTAAELLGMTLDRGNPWGSITDHLIAWDIPAPPNYLTLKRSVFTTMVPGWEKLFVDGTIDWRQVSWGGVLIDDRPYDTTDERCNCIPAADNPEVSGAEEADWLDDSDIVFGIVVNGEARAYPRQIMEVREMVNDTLGGRDLGIPYCTLCASAQAYFTDNMPAGVERPVLRTSGLLIRSNKVMYDINSHSIFDTFLGRAVTGPLAEQNIQLDQTTVITTQWGEWKKAYPQTTVLKEHLALGRDFDFRNTRDADGPIFPVGNVDPRLPVHEDIVGVLTAEGDAVAFQRSKAQSALLNDETVTLNGVRLQSDAGGIRAEDEGGNDLVSHQAFWFAWSQFYPQTQLWPLAE